MRRWVLNLTVLVSLLLCAASAALWAVSSNEFLGVGTLIVSRKVGARHWLAGAHHNKFDVSWEDNDFRFSPTNVNDRDWQTPVFKVELEHEPAAPQRGGGNVSVPSWFVCAITAILPALQFAALPRRR